MKLSRKFFVPAALLGVLLFCFWGHGWAGQSSTVPVGSEAQWDAERRFLAQSFAQLMASGAGAQQMDVWQQQNAARVAAWQQHEVQQSQQAGFRPLPVINEVEVSADATPAQENCLVQAVQLANEYATLHNSLQNADEQTRRQAAENWLQQHAQDLAARQQSARAVADQAAAKTQPLLPVPDAPAIPVNATAAHRAFWTQRYALIREEIQLRNQYRASPPAEREQVLAAWQQQNAQRFAALQELARQMAAERASKP